MKILHILDHSIPAHSGYTFRTLSILREQRRQGLRTAHLTGPKQPGAPTAGVEHVDGLNFYRTESRYRGFRPGPLGQWSVVEDIYDRLVEVIPREQPDVLHAHSPALNGLAAVRAGKKFGIPVVYEIRAFWEDAAVDHGTASEDGLRYRLTRALETRVVRQADHVTTICEGLRKNICGRGIDTDRVTVIPNAVDPERFPRLGGRDEALERELGLEGCETIGFIGSFYAYEGVPLLLDAVERLAPQHPRLRLVLVGGGPQADDVAQQVSARGLDAQVRMLGRVPHGDVQRYYSLIDVLAYPRLSKRITERVTPLKPLEAMAQGQLVVASDVGGHQELIDDRKTGYLFRAGDADALAQTLHKALVNKSHANQIKDLARVFVQTERSWPRSVARYHDVYARALARHQARQPADTAARAT